MAIAIFAAVSFIAAVVYAALLHLYRKDVNSMTSELRQINKERSNRRLTVDGGQKTLACLAEEINSCLDKNIEIEAAYIRADTELRNAIADMSHDLRTPLTSIMGYLQLMQDDDTNSGERQEYLRIVQRRAQSLQNLICSFYDLSRLQAGEYRFELKSLNMANVLTDIVASFYNDFLRTGIEPSIDIDMGTPNVIGDESAVARIFANLIQNSLKYAKSYITIYQGMEGDRLLTVFTNDSDNMDEESAVKIFDRFFTADRMRTGQNTGLGLAITKELARQMGHSVFASYSAGCLSITVSWKIVDSMKNYIHEQNN